MSLQTANVIVLHFFGQRWAPKMLESSLFKLIVQLFSLLLFNCQLSNCQLRHTVQLFTASNCPLCQLSAVPRSTAQMTRMTAAAAAHTVHSQYCRQSNPSDWANTVRRADRQWRELPCGHLASQKIITACALRIVPAWDFGEGKKRGRGGMGVDFRKWK